ncbi:aminotransferase class I/II-fold pyridoxal phosphate-dependent enzyme [Deinococcus sp. AJ005]|uniref:aminotransferase class I/II-fold pyridoxal phosphate-dependent enzyme n=1 Tax=Deinococcus sp. AJ005 TaxID=2652443 RepID=UPI00125CC109|nr:aminotransferase class I/II-fold pyridoxal phosphate-dependent enzyme [Deinococcus sp. AJ005]QFP77311.1 aminopeptidase [Deinococcus sp. AJ005]
MTRDGSAPAAADALSAAQTAYDAIRAKGLKLNMQRGQPSDADFDLSNGLLGTLGETDLSMDGIDLRNYPGGIAGLPSARRMFADYLDVKAENVIVWNNASLELQGFVLTFALLHGVRGSTGPWVKGESKPKFIVTIPGYDRHFLLLQTLGFELVAVDMQHDGPDLDAIERLAAADANIKGILFVPTYSNPGGETISAEKAQRLAALKAAAPDFTILADDAYRAHHLGTPPETVNFVTLCRDAGHPDRAFVFASTSKITLAGAGLGFVATSEDNIKWMSKYLNAQSIGPNKPEQARHVKFLGSYPGGIDGLMRDHAALIAPKFRAVGETLRAELGEGDDFATWANPQGGYFISLDTTAPVAARVVELADAAGVSLTPAGATYPDGKDPGNRNIRIAPTRPPVGEVYIAMSAVAACIRLATEEYRAGQQAQGRS